MAFLILQLLPSILSQFYRASTNLEKSFCVEFSSVKTLTGTFSGGGASLNSSLP